MEQSLILLFIGIGAITSILILHYGTKIASYCCLENFLAVKQVSHSVVKPPRWSNCLASKVEYIDDTALDIIRERIEYVESLVIRKLGAIALVSRNEGFLTTIILRWKFIIVSSRKIGVLKTIKLLLNLIYLKRLYRKSSRLLNRGKNKQRYYDIVERILKHLDYVVTSLEALPE